MDTRYSSRSFVESAKRASAYVGIAGDGWKLEDWHNFGVDYAHTCRAWRENAVAAKQSLPADKYNARFWRMWDYYLLGSSAGFAERSIHLWQFVLSPQGLPYVEGKRGGYQSLR